MNKKTMGVVALSTLTLTLLSGCANITDQIAKKMAEGVVNQASGGKVNMSDSNGNITFKDNQGNEAQVGGGDKRPSSVPADMPSLPTASGYGWFGSADGGIFTFTVASADYLATCDQMVSMIKAAGWADSKTGFNMEVQGTKTTMYEKTGYTLSLTCSTDTSSNKESVITLTKTKQDAPSSTSTTTTTSNDTGATVGATEMTTGN